MYYSKYVDYFFNLNSLDKIAAQIVNEIDFKIRTCSLSASYKTV